MNEGSGTTAHDQSGWMNDAVFNVCGTSTLPQWISDGHKTTYGLYFDGLGEYLSATSNNLFKTGPVSGFTYVGWIKSSSPGHYGENAIIDYYSNVGSHAAFLVDTGSYFIHENSPGDTKFFYNLNNIFDNSWHFVAMSYSSNNSANNFFDSTEFSGTANGSQLQFNSSSGGLWLAGDRGDGCSTYNSMGIISDLRIYNRALSASEIQALYNATK